jgi:hypothetical protein
MGLDPETLSVLWKWPDPGEEFVAFDTCWVRYRENGELTIVDLSTMKERVVQTEPRAALGALLGLCGNLLCEFPLTEGGRRAVDVDSGATIWKSAEPPVYWSSRFEGDVCYAGGETGVSAYDLRSGSLLWRQNFGRPSVGMKSNLRLVNKRLYLGLQDRTVRVLDTNTGKELLSYRAAAEVEAVTALDDNHIVFGTRNTIACLEVS